MKKTTRHAWRILAVVAAAIVIAGCDDGTLGTPLSPDIMPPAPEIIKFDAEPTAIKSGEQTTIRWEVAGADQVEITAVTSAGEALDFHIESEDLSGTAPVTLTSTTDFVLTATKTADNLETEEGEEDEGDAELASGGQIQFGPADEEKDELPEPSGSATPAISQATRTITVTVSGGSELSATMQARDSKVAACGQTVIEWTVSPAENVSVSVTASTGEAISPTDQCDGSIEDILGQPTLETTPAVGCAVVAPCEPTTYTVDATDAAGTPANASATVEIEGDVTATIKAGPRESSFDNAEDTLYKVDSYQDPIMIHWKVDPETAKVTITATPSAVCDEALPTDAADKATGSLSCTLTGETTFEIAAAMGSEEPAKDKVIITSGGGGSAGLFVADQWAFEGEKIEVEMQLTPGSNADAVSSLTINGSAIPSSLVQQLKSGSTIKVPDVTATAPNVVFKMYDAQNKELDSREKIQVIELVVDLLDQDEVAYTSMKFDDDGKRLAGVQRDSFHDGEAKIYIENSAKYFNFMDPIKEAFNMENLWNDAFFEYVNDYPVAVAARDGMPEHVFAGTSGVLMWSLDGGETWREPKEAPMINRRIIGPNYQKPKVEDAKKGDHLSCGRQDYNGVGGPKLMRGSNYRDTGDIAGLNQICDVYVSAEGWAVVATDFGVFVEKNLDNNVDNADYVWIGEPKKGATHDEIVSHGVHTYSKIVNALAVKPNQLGGIEKVFAATASPYSDIAGTGDTEGAVYVSLDGGIHWRKYGAISGGSAVYALAYDERNQRLYAGTENGLYYARADVEFTADESNYTEKVDVQWEATALGDPVISVAVDPKSPETKMTILAGTPTGVSISRDGGGSWSALAVNEGVEAAVEALAISAKETQGNIKYGIAIGSTAGQLVQSVTVGATEIGGGGGGDDPQPAPNLPTYQAKFAGPQD